ncbi:hypothetical protein IFM89_017123, partial [Coptis chinensis]
KAKLLLPSERPRSNIILPKCCLCSEASYRSTLIYVNCESCQVQAATTASTVVIRHTIDLPLSRFTWIVRNFSQLNNRKYYSNIFLAGGFKWRVLIFPKGNNVDHLSTYLDVQDSSNLPDGWSKYSEFSLSVVDQVHNYCSY